MTDVAILVPLSTTLDPWRLLGWRYVRKHLVELGWPIITGRCDNDVWSKGAALARARQLVPEADVLVIHDADVLVPPKSLLTAAHYVGDVYQGAEWVIPHELVYRLTEESTQHVLDGAPLDVGYGHPLVRDVYTGYAGGGVTVVRGDVWDDCPMDPRFVGWGSEDQAWAWALETMHGPPLRGQAPLWHFYHPHAAPGVRRNVECHDLWRSYRHHRERPDLMSGLLAGARAAAEAALPSAPCRGT